MASSISLGLAFSFPENFKIQKIISNISKKKSLTELLVIEFIQSIIIISLPITKLIVNKKIGLNKYHSYLFNILKEFLEKHLEIVISNRVD
ncbi:hypothetical protein Xsto_00939 [Xenorhabdus stockiae]|uniref:Uncharacterized protein n=1 Tax=Xenorhabdus stockiae TaxID=351614 RepID=A0A2D0KT70_9GAMM|nr:MULTISPECIES: hypothetical protein [Xenorhabdus]PHM66611.1 hypothetical protein Xsto_00939 [Xenorhabdus stockiae]PHM68776.1 hypothetical protein Xekj_03002 [Xenorhabdus sp. KJ12.1]